MTADTFENDPGKCALRVHNAKSVINEVNYFGTDILSPPYEIFESPRRFGVGISFSTGIVAKNNVI